MRSFKTNIKENFDTTQADMLSDAHSMCHDPKVKAAERARAGAETYAKGLADIFGAGSLLDRGFKAANKATKGLPDDRTILDTMKTNLSAIKWAATQNLMEEQANFDIEAFKTYTNIQGKCDANIKYINSRYTFLFEELEYGSIVLGCIIIILLLYILVGL